MYSDSFTALSTAPADSYCRVRPWGLALDVVTELVFTAHQTTVCHLHNHWKLATRYLTPWADVRARV